MSLSPLIIRVQWEAALQLANMQGACVGWTVYVRVPDGG